MCTRATGIGSDEPILRRIPKAPGFYASQKVPPLERGAFTPNERDDDGLSFYLERELSIEELVRRATRPPTEIVVIRLVADDVYKLGLTLVRVLREGDEPGHVVIPEINWHDYQDKNLKRRIKEAANSLVQLGLQGIVFGI